MKVFIVAGVLVWLSGSATVQAEGTTGCAELLRNRCQTCHYLNRVCGQVGEKSKRRWIATVKRMVKRRGAMLNKEEQEYLVDCLLVPAPDVKEECKK